MNPEFAIADSMEVLQGISGSTAGAMVSGIYSECMILSGDLSTMRTTPKIIRLIVFATRTTSAAGVYAEPHVWSPPVDYNYHWYNNQADYETRDYIKITSNTVQTRSVKGTTPSGNAPYSVQLLMLWF